MPKTLIVSLDGWWRCAQIAEGSPDGIEPSAEGCDFFTAEVPGEIHKDMIRENRLPNLFSGVEACAENEWVCEAEWLYQKSFDLPEGLADDWLCHIHLDSVDTFADVFVNGELVGVTGNAFIRQCFAIPRSILLPQGNRLSVRMKAHRRMVAHKASEALERCAVDSDMGREYAKTRSLTRRSQRTYSAELTGCGRYIIGIGLTKSVSLSFAPVCRITDRIFRVTRANEELALIHLEADVAEADENVKLHYVLAAENGDIAAEGTAFVNNGKAVADFKVDNPLLWWPNGFGPQNLYELKLALCTGGAVCFEEALTVGIRQFDLIRKLPNGKPTFRFFANGKPIYIFGGNLMPIDYLTATGNREQSEAILDLAVHTGINMMRLWGGGNNESEWFYEMCDRKGIMIYKDMHLHSHTYPDYDDEFVAEVVHEAVETVRYLRNHPSLAILCGGNEQQELWEAYHWSAYMDRFYGARLIYEELNVVCQRECPEIAYIPNSPHGEKLSQSPVDGDTHTWGNFYNVTKDPQFVTETCWFYGSFPHPATMEKVMDIKLDDFTSLGWQKKWRELTGQELIGNHQYGEYHMLGSLREYMLSMEVEQFLADYNALFYLRCRSASCNGIIYWPFNKGGMFILFGCIDYDQRPQMSYYLLRRLFAPVCCHLYRDISDIHLVASNAGWDTVQAECVVKHMHTDGRLIQTWRKPVSIRNGNAQRLMDLTDYYQNIDDRWNEMLRAEIYVDGKMIAYDDLYFCLWSEFDNQKAAVQAVVEDDCLTITSTVLAKMIYLDSEEKLLFEDNCFSLMPGESRTIHVKPMAGAKQAAISIASLDSETVNVEMNW